MERHSKPVRSAETAVSKSVDHDKQRWSRLSAPLSASGKIPSSSAITKHLLNTLSDSSNPITHSNIYERSDTVVPAATGHQRGEGKAPHGMSARAYFEARSKKLSLQRKDINEVPTGRGVLAHVRIYIDGHLSGTTDINMKRLVSHAGGTILLAPSGATHIVSSRQLNALKTHRIMTTKSRNPVHVVKPEWVTESITLGDGCQSLIILCSDPPEQRTLLPC